MLKLYSFGPGANSLKPLLSLYEKGLEWEHNFLDPAKFEQHSDWFKKINPRGQVPALEHDGRIITESTVICEYLEDVFPNDNPLRPADPYLVAQMRVWTKWVDEYFCWCVSTIGWERHVKHIANSMSAAEFEERISKIPVPEQQTKWRRARDGFPKDLIEEEMRKIGISVRRLEDTLSHCDYLVGDQFTLADVCNFAIANGMPIGFPELVNERDTPGILAWLERINARPACQQMFAQTKRENLGPKQE